MKLTHKSEKFETLEPFCLVFRTGMSKDFDPNTHNTKSRRVIGPENILLARVSMHLSPEILQAGAVKELNISKHVTYAE